MMTPATRPQPPAISAQPPRQTGLRQSRLIAGLVIGTLILLTLLLLTSRFYLYAFMPALGLLGLWLLLYHPRFGAYLLVFLIPFGALRKFSVATVEININWVIATLLLMIVLARRLLTKPPQPLVAIPLWPWLVLFMLLQLIATALSPYPHAAMADLKLWLAGFFYLALLVQVIPVQGLEQMLPKVVIVAVFVSSLLGNLGFFFGLTVSSLAGERNVSYRNLGGAIDANNLSLMVIACLPLIAHGLLHTRARWAKLLYVGALCNGVIAIGTSYSRGGFMIFLLAMLLILIEYRQHFKARYFGFILLGLSLSLAGFVSLMPDSFWQRQSSLVTWQDTSLVRRSAYLRVAADAVVQRPLSGHGPDSFYTIFAQSRYAKIGKEDGKRQGRYAHNSYIEVLVGSGVPGLILFLLILAKGLSAFTEVKRRFMVAGQRQQASFIGSCRLFLLLVLIYLLIFSETHHKFMLLGLVMSQLALPYWRYWQPPGANDKNRETTHG